MKKLLMTTLCVAVLEGSRAIAPTVTGSNYHGVK
ncbi:putative lipoprotein [Actinobacillus ureae]|nr:putative lipoprotein [Actinobacillus ureae]SUU46520.1 putative lipoprotein [Actinobacillus ureae]